MGCLDLCRFPEHALNLHHASLLSYLDICFRVQASSPENPPLAALHHLPWPRARFKQTTGHELKSPDSRSSKLQHSTSRTCSPWHPPQRRALRCTTEAVQLTKWNKAQDCPGRPWVRFETLGTACTTPLAVKAGKAATGGARAKWPIRAKRLHSPKYNTMNGQPDMTTL